MQQNQESLDFSKSRQRLTTSYQLIAENLPALSRSQFRISANQQSRSFAIEQIHLLYNQTVLFRAIKVALMVILQLTSLRTRDRASHNPKNDKDAHDDQDRHAH